MGNKSSTQTQPTPSWASTSHPTSFTLIGFDGVGKKTLLRYLEYHPLHPDHVNLETCPSRIEYSFHGPGKAVGVLKRDNVTICKVDMFSGDPHVEGLHKDTLRKNHDGALIVVDPRLGPDFLATLAEYLGRLTRGIEETRDMPLLVLVNFLGKEKEDQQSLREVEQAMKRVLNKHPMVSLLTLFNQGARLILSRLSEVLM